MKTSGAGGAEEQRVPDGDRPPTAGDHAAEAPELAARLLHAWRGEVEAGKVYSLIADRESDQRRAGILRELAVAESSHRRRLEERMRQLDIAPPEESSVRLSWWLRLQVRLAPIDRLLAAREAAESSEVSGTYGLPTGDTTTDALMREIGSEEQSHSHTMRTLIAGRLPEGFTDPAAPSEQAAPPSSESGEPTSTGEPLLPSEGIEGILGRERWHSRGGGWISGAIYGANDGLAAVFGIVAGVSGATNGGSFVLTAGLAGAIASALSMATGAFLAERSEMEVAAANLDQERREIEQHPEEEERELALIYQLKGMDKASAEKLAASLAEHPEAMLSVLAAEELGSLRSDGNPWQAALAGGLSTAAGAIIPVLPFTFMHGTAAIAAAAAISLVAHFLVGAAKSLVTLRSWWAAGLEMTFAGVIVGGALYGVGLVLPVSG